MTNEDIARRLGWMIDAYYAAWWSGKEGKFYPDGLPDFLNDIGAAITAARLIAKSKNIQIEVQTNLRDINKVRAEGQDDWHSADTLSEALCMWIMAATDEREGEG